MNRRNQWPYAMGTLAILLGLFFWRWEATKATRLELAYAQAGVAAAQCALEAGGRYECTELSARRDSAKQRFDAFEEKR